MEVNRTVNKSRINKFNDYGVDSGEPSWFFSCVSFPHILFLFCPSLLFCFVLPFSEGGGGYSCACRGTEKLEHVPVPTLVPLPVKC